MNGPRAALIATVADGTPHRDAQTRSDRWAAIIGGVATALLILLATFRTEEHERDRYLQSVQVHTLQHASVLRARLEGALNARLHLAHGLGAFAKARLGDIQDFSAFAEGMTQSGLSGVLSLQLSPNAVVTHVYPRAGNEKIIGHDLLADPNRREAVQRTIRERLFVVAGPVRLLQGGRGLIARLPLFTEDRGDESFWGFATVVLDVDAVLEDGGIWPALDDNYEVALRGKDALGPAGAVFYGNTGLFDREPVLMDVNLPHGSWQIALLPKHGWPSRSPYGPFIWMIGGLLAALGGAFAFTRINEPAKLRREVARATIALHDSEEQFRRVAESATDAIISADSRGLIVFWNPAAADIFGYPAAEAIGRPLSELVIPPEQRGLHPESFEYRAINATKRLGHLIETTGMRRDGMIIQVEMTLSHWMAGGQHYFTAIVRDITARKQNEQEQAVLRERYFHAQKMEAIGRLASGAAHEFNNILNGLLANAEAAAAEVDPDSPAAESMHQVLTSGWRAADIVQQLLVFSEREGQPYPTLSPHQAIEQMVGRLREQLPPNIHLVEAIEPGQHMVPLAHDQFCHLVWNLFMNSCRAMLKSGGELNVALSEVHKTDAEFLARAAEGLPGMGGWARLAVGKLSGGAYARLTVQDTGCGMDQETLARVFEPFYTTEPVGSGTGLGLSVVHGMIENLGGAIIVHSSPGLGSRFDIYMPLLREPVPA